jgi:hypothetical protein
MLPSYVWNYGGPADNIGFTPFAHTLVWEGKKYKTASIYYMLPANWQREKQHSST